ncbi:MAG: hypothetical protein J2P21_02475 [Chloracidobacterium sp.]|nr:hypothetical protein [Chloracidobacterium sp.]
MISPAIVLQQRYRIIRLIARSGIGAVYEAEAIYLRGAVFAFKETFFEENNKSMREQFKREAGTLARLRHRSLPQINSDAPTEGSA